MKRYTTALLLLLALHLAGCNGAAAEPTQEPPDMNAFQEDIDKLATVITLPARPTSARWTQYTLGIANSDLPGPTDYVVLAVLRYDATTAAQIASQLSAGTETREWYVEESFIRPWFPDEVKGTFVYDELAELFTLNQPAYEPTPFMKGSLQQGYAYVVGEYVVVYLQTT